jgi:hypothetical protein
VSVPDASATDAVPPADEADGDGLLRDGPDRRARS